MPLFQTLDFSRRIHSMEWMDQPDCSEPRLLRTVDQFDLINRLFSRSMGLLERWILRDMAREPARSWRMTDLGAGGCDLPLRLLARARRQGLKLTITAVDGDPRIVRHVREKFRGAPGLDIREADALDGDAWPDSDYVFGNHFLHHLTDEQIVELLRLVRHKTGRRALFNDLRRSRWIYTGFGLTAPLLFRDSFARDDGLLSIRRGFRPGELLACAENADWERERITEGTLQPGRVFLLLSNA